MSSRMLPRMLVHGMEIVSGSSRLIRPHNEQAVSAVGGDLDGALHMLLAAHIGEVCIVVAMAREECGEILACVMSPD